MCEQCDAYLCGENTSEAKRSKNIWPAFVWTVLINEKVRAKYNDYVWTFLPLEWRGWWINSVKKYEVYENVSLFNPATHFRDVTLAKKDFDERIGTGLIAQLAIACNTHMIMKILCPFGCTEFCFHLGHMPFDCIWQRYLPKCIIQLIGNVEKMKVVRTTRDDYIRTRFDYDRWLYNPDWEVKPSVLIDPVLDPVVISCRNHHGGTSKYFIYPPRQPGHILPAPYADQMTHTVIKPRTIAPMKAKKYSNQFQMHEQRGTFNGIDTCSVTTFHNFALTSNLLRENEHRSIVNRPDINNLLDKLCVEKKLPSTFVQNIRENARNECRDIDFQYYMSGATYVPVSAALDIHLVAKQKPLTVIWDDRGENLPPIQQYCKKAFPSVIFPLQKVSPYGTPFPPIPKYTYRAESTLILWILSGLMTRVEILWQNIGKVILRQSGWEGWMLAHLTKKCFSSTNFKSENTDPFQVRFINRIERLLGKVQNCFFENSIGRCMSRVPGVYFGIEIDNIDFFVDSDIHDIIIVEKEDIFFDDIPLELVCDDQKYELCCILSHQQINATEYNAEIFGRHGGSHSKWFYQGRKDPYCIQIDDDPVLEIIAMRIIVWKKVAAQDIQKINIEFMKNIGGQTHVVCGVHNMPLVTMFDKIKKCNCGRKELYGCPDLTCRTCICNACFQDKSTDTIHNWFHNPTGENVDVGDVDGDEDPVDVDEFDDFFGEVEEASVDESSDTESVFFEDDAGEHIDNFDDFVIRSGEADDNFLDDSGSENGDDDDMEFYVPTTDAGELPFQIIEEEPARGKTCSGHVLMNQCGSVLTRKAHELSTSTLHKYFLQNLCATHMGTSVPLIYPEGSLFPSIFYSMKDNSVVGAIPASLLSELISSFGFSSLPDHIRSRLTSSSHQTSTNPR